MGSWACAAVRAGLVVEPHRVAWKLASRGIGCGVRLGGAFGASRAGASRRSIIYAVLGSVAGALLGGILGLPVPIVGSLLAALLFGSLGATAGAMYGEWSDGKSWQESWTVGHAAFWGRLFGTLGKIVAGGAIVVTVVLGVVL